MKFTTRSGPSTSRTAFPTRRLTQPRIPSVPPSLSCYPCGLLPSRMSISGRTILLMSPSAARIAALHVHRDLLGKVAGRHRLVTGQAMLRTCEVRCGLKFTYSVRSSRCPPLPARRLARRAVLPFPLPCPRGHFRGEGVELVTIVFTVFFLQLENLALDGDRESSWKGTPPLPRLGQRLDFAAPGS